MKKNYLFTLLLTICLGTLSFGQTIFINEIHYDDESGDSDEGVEIAGPSGTDLTGYKIILYNGSSSQLKVYGTTDLTGVISDQQSGYGTIWFPISGIQNGSPDGIAFVDASDTLIQFLSYEGKFTAVDGPASGIESVDIGVEETGTVEGESLQLTGSGTIYTNFSWAPSATATRGASNNGQTFGGTPMPALTIPAPSNNKEFSPEISDVDVSLSVTNFNVASGGAGDGFIEYSVDGGATIQKFNTTDISLTSLASGSHTVNVELVDNAGNSLSPAVTSTVSFSIASYTTVATLADLRAGAEDSYYIVSGEVVLTYARSNRNQKYIQDATAGILIDDSSGTITTTYNTNDGITGLRGRLGAFSGVSQFVPTVDPGAASSTANSITPEVVALADFVANYNDYESELIKIEEVTFADAGGTFSSAESYDISSAGTTSVFRTNFSEADYIGETIPTGTTDLTVLGGEFNGTGQVTAINLAGIVLGLKNNEVEGFGVYPNPVVDGRFTVSSLNADAKEVSIFNILGKKVLTESFSGTSKSIEVNTLNTGVYILKVKEGNNISTKKLVIR